MSSTYQKSGQTLGMVKSLPSEGSIVVVHSAPLRDYVRAMIRDVRGPDLLKNTAVVVCDSQFRAEAFLRGRRTPVFIDHAFYNSVSAVVFHTVIVLAERCNLDAKSHK